MNHEHKVIGKAKVHYSKIIGKAEVQEQQQKQQGFPHPSPYDELSTVFHPPKQKTSLKSDILTKGSSKTGLLEDVVKEGMKKKKNI
ncbi:hypothetical protein Bca4012_040135 [Brassica carinata]|uniref:Uncharacterized protein n=1 Tax=Brassica carinata TaxID=52824 RepID=A0A8X7W946_BRACI|nr:hypothetical protein Bca52824_008364 [Brassica carinata]